GRRGYIRRTMRLRRVRIGVYINCGDFRSLETSVNRNRAVAPCCVRGRWRFASQKLSPKPATQPTPMRRKLLRDNGTEPGCLNKVLLGRGYRRAGPTCELPGVASWPAAHKSDVRSAVGRDSLSPAVPSPAGTSTALCCGWAARPECKAV